MLGESSEKNMVKKEVKEPPKGLTSCNNRLDVEDCYLYHSIPHTLSCSFISGEQISALQTHCIS